MVVFNNVLFNEGSAAVFTFALLNSVLVNIYMWHEPRVSGDMLSHFICADGKLVHLVTLESGLFVQDVTGVAPKFTHCFGEFSFVNASA